MDWDMKMGSWDLVELERDSEPNIGSVVGSGVGAQTRDLDCSVDLKLGGLGDFVSSSKWKEQMRTSSTVVSSAGPSKRARAPGNGSQIASCLVDGCTSDLSNCREYHRRHKVCEAHSKTPIVLVGGQEQRFCQQCSRFHLLVEFDEVKRSCRKRLDGHNRRRRKPQVEPINSGTLHPSFQDHRFSSYPHIFTGATSEPSWSNAVKHEDETLYRLHSPLQFIDRQRSNYPGTFSHNYREGKRFPFLHDNDAAISSQAALETPACQPLLRTISFTENRSNGRKMFSDGLTHVLDSDCALSLLSSPTETRGVNNLSQMVPAGQIPIAQPLPHSMQQYGGGLGRFSRSQSSNNVSTTGFSCSVMDEEQAGTVLVSDSSNAELQCPSGLFNVGGDGSSGGPTTILPFSWQ